MGTEVQQWVDEAMFPAERSNAKEGPRAYLIQGTPDPLGSIAVAAKAYIGEFFESKDEITDDDRRYYLEEIQKTKLKMPMEAVMLHWRLKGVTRSFTHQMVRQRTAAYSQESMRFAVKEDASDAVALPPSLQGFNLTIAEGLAGDHVWEAHKDVELFSKEFDLLPKSVRWYLVWRDTCDVIGDRYNYLVNDGMPAEDARGLLAHNSVTQLNYITNLRNYQDHAGNRLCTQAQFEWRMVWVRMLEAMRVYCTCEVGAANCARQSDWCDNWQWVAIADLFKPVCYLTGSCQFQAMFDRKCSIRDRVQANAGIGRESSEWDKDYTGHEHGDFIVGVDGEPKDNPVYIGAIHPAEWILDAGAAR